MISTIQGGFDILPFRFGPVELLLLMLPVFLVGLAVYFAPSIIAAGRRHPNVLAIFLIDFLTGWTVVGWIAALVWSLVTLPVVRIGNPGALEIAESRYAKGEISLSEFDEIKRNLRQTNL
jgi:hypothetical protein